MENTCVQCGETREAIKLHKLYCAGVDSYTGETTWEAPRHRFRPFSEKELAGKKRDEEKYLEQMQGFADFVNKQEATPQRDI